MTTTKRMGVTRRSKVLKQLRNWVESETVLRLITSAQAFSVFHTGRLQTLDGSDDIFYVEPNEGGGVFEISPSDCPTLIERTDEYTIVCFCNGKLTPLKLMEYFADAKRRKRPRAKTHHKPGQARVEL
jgi:hypothetical protein